MLPFTFILRPLWRNSKLPSERTSNPSKHENPFLIWDHLGPFESGSTDVIESLSPPLFVHTPCCGPRLILSEPYPLHVLFIMTDWPKHNHCQNIFVGMDRRPEKDLWSSKTEKNYKSAVNILWKEDTCTLVKKRMHARTKEKYGESIGPERFLNFHPDDKIWLVLTKLWPIQANQCTVHSNLQNQIFPPIKQVRLNYDWSWNAYTPKQNFTS